MREDRLSPLLGRLIDAAKTEADGEAKAGDAAEVGGAVEAVALLTEDGALLSRASRVDDEIGGCGAAVAALAAHKEARGGHIDAVAVAVLPSRDDVSPCPRCRAALAAVDPELPVVTKQSGRWVILPLTDV